MSVKRNVSVSFLSQAFFVVSRLIVVPIYLHLLGVEAYGLVGLFVLFTAMIQLLNLGISSTTSREISRMRGGATTSATVHHHLRRSFLTLSAISALFAAAVILFAPLIAADWLHVTSIAPGDVVRSLRLMAAAAALSLVSNLYKGGLQGLERQVTLNLTATIFAALRAFGVVAVLMLVAPTPVVFCAYQLAVSVAEVIVFYNILRRAMPSPAGDVEISADHAMTLRRFSTGIAFTEIVWLAVLQCDKAVLSTALALSAYGYFTAMTTAAYGVMLLAAPFMQVLQPRFATLAAGRRDDELRSLYRRVSYGLTALAASAAIVMVLFPSALIYDWTGNHAIAAWSAAVLPIYAIGNALSAVMGLPFLLQFALGDIRLHVWGHLACAVGYIPAAIWLGLHHGAQGTGAAWLAMNFLYFAIVVPMVHTRLLPGGHVRWLLKTFVPAAGLPLCVLLSLWAAMPLPDNRLTSALLLCVYGAGALAAGLFASREYRALAASLGVTLLKFLRSITANPAG